MKTSFFAVSATLLRTVQACLAKDPADRPDSARELFEMLDGHGLAPPSRATSRTTHSQTPEPATVPPVTPPPTPPVVPAPMPSPPRRSPALLLGFIGLFAVIAAVAALNEISVFTTADPDLKTATYSYTFVAHNSANGKWSRGVAHDEISVRNLGGQPRITRFRQTTSDRKKNF